MKDDLLAKLTDFEKQLRSLKRELKALRTSQVSQKSIREKSRELATEWVERIRPILQSNFPVAAEALESDSKQLERFFVLSRPNNLVSSYLAVLDTVLKDFKNKYILPVQTTSKEVNEVTQLDKLLEKLGDEAENEYMQEAINCAKSGYRRAAIVMAWAAVIDRLQRKVEAIGFDAFNQASTKLKNKTTGTFKRWNKVFDISSISELQQSVSDGDLLTIFEGGLGILDGNQAERLRTNLEYRHHSAHPGGAPIEEEHLVVFFSDIIGIVFTNPKLTL